VAVRQPSGEAPRAIVAGALANKPGNGGEAWVRLSWVAGLARLGFRVLFLEQIRAAACVDDAGRPTGFAESTNRRWFRELVDAFGLSGSACLVCDDGQTEGLTVSEVLEQSDGAVILVNISGHLRSARILSRARCRVFIDIDPGFTQFWHLQGVGARLEGHDHYFTIAESLGKRGCSIPSVGIPWKTMRQPVVLDWWPVEAVPAGATFTTVATWRCPSGAITASGHTFSQKHHQFRRYADLPALARRNFQAALDIHPSDRCDADSLTTGGWDVVDARTVAADPFAFRRYIQGSLAEFSVAQGVYVETKSGWFSDRSVHYLASGRPVLLQETGFSDNLPVGSGLVPFEDIGGAVRGAKDICARYAEHSEAARDLALRYFASDVVLGGFLDEVGASP
jgi:hypothetical protein